MHSLGVHRGSCTEDSSLRTCHRIVSLESARAGADSPLLCGQRAHQITSEALDLDSKLWTDVMGSGQLGLFERLPQLIWSEWLSKMVLIAD